MKHRRNRNTHRSGLRSDSIGLCLAAVVILLLFSTGCARQQGPQQYLIELDTDSHLRDRIDSLIAQYPPPEGFTLVSPRSVVSETEPEASKPVAGIRIFQSEPAQAPMRGNDTGDPADEDAAASYVLDRSPLVPIVPLTDPRSDVTVETALTLPLVSLTDAVLPLKGLTVEGLAVNNPEYALYQETILQLDWHPASVDTQTPKSIEPEKKRTVEQWCTQIARQWPAGAEIDTDVRWIAGVGDMMVSRGIQDILISKGEAGLQRIFHDTLAVLQAQDLLIGNLEGAVTTRGTPTPKSYNFRFLPQVLPRLKQAGFDYLSVTNNHCYDYGETGFTDTLDHLRASGIATSGAGRTPAEAAEPFVADLRGMQVQVLSVGAYPQEKNGFDGRTRAQVSDSRAGILFSGDHIIDMISGFSEPDSIDVIVAHGGEEWQREPSAEQRAFYRSCIDAGADIVFAHHPHVLQGMEAYKGGLIAYSLGNFLFPGMYGMPYAEETIILSIGFVGNRPVYVRPIPVRIDNRELSLENPPGEILTRFLDLTGDLNPNVP